MSRVLLVEDNPASRRLLGDHLRRVGHEVHAVESADAALVWLDTARVDLVIMDVQLPGTDGLTATRRLRARPETRHVPVLAVTAHAMKGDEERILEAGADAYLAKPIYYQEFLALVAELLARDDAAGS